MTSCGLCGRRHSGVCGIPPCVNRTLATAAAPSRGAPVPSTLHQKSGGGWGPSRTTLNELLRWSLQEQQKLERLLRLPPDHVEDYDAALERYDKLREAVHQIRLQLLEKAS